eukprot:TRINITY_DN1145_c0_g1_i1.p1 TRINITY_DN1145_c0_g1~~TRINITY_DN1145_c0_g1_i1.p1  ORF type:complete len:274 (-),score=70.17 TRINITY_DN1145_c0_g1_i1:142-963(-)
MAAVPIRSIMGLLGLGGIGALASSSLYVVDAGHRGVIFSRFDGVQNKVYGEGFNFIVPWIQRYFLYDTRTQPFSIQASTGSKDMQTITLTVRVLFRPRVDTLPEIHQKYGQDYQDKILPSIGNEVIKAAVAQYDAGELITQREQVSRQIRENLTQRATEFNIELDDVSITHLKFGSEYTYAIERKQVEQQEAERLKYIVQKNEQEQRAVVIRAEGQSEAAKLVNDAMESSGKEFIILRRLEAACDIAESLSHARNVSYLPPTSNILVGINQGK